MASGYQCSPCDCPPNYVDLYIDPGSATLVVGNSRQFRAYALDQDCNGGLWPCDVTGGDAVGATYWSSYNPSVATVGYGLVSAQKAGSATIKATYQGWKYFPDFSGYCMPDYMIELNAYSTANVKASISSISPARGLVGVTTNVTITGKGFGTNPTVNAGTGITVTRNSFTDTQIQASFAVASNAPSGNHSVTVTTPQGTSNSVNFYVQVP